MTKADLDSDSTATDQSGYAQTLGSIGANQGVFFAGGRAVVLTGENAALAMAQDGQIRWTADGNAGGGTIDTGLARDSAGVVKTTDGASGAGSLHVTGNLSVDGVGRTIFVRKTADETVNNSSALQDDNHLVAAVAASATYIVEAFVIYDAATAADLKLAFTGPSGATLDWTSTALGTAATAGTGSLTVSASTIGDGSAVPLGGVGAGTKVVAQIRGLLVVAGTAGNLTTRWAQNTANASDAIVRTNSWMRLTRVA
ncbi:hypothetical protein GCM10017673_56610 [Streptosporangium violaceochromogenes]|nr:hypothetical protein GCM10017673_56610 [Streptosporangium violaceochromogenes]